MAWNLNTQKRHLKHTDAPPDDCVAWEGYMTQYLDPTYHRVYGSPQQIIHNAIEYLLGRLEAEPNRWFRMVIYGESGFQTSNGFVADNQVTYYRPLTLYGPFCKEKGVMPEFIKNGDLYELPFNLPEGACDPIPYDPAKPDFGDEDSHTPVLQTEPIPAGTEIVVLDEWGLEAATTEVI